MLLADPVTMANIENTPKKIFLYSIQFPVPKLSGHRKTLSTTAGTRRPKLYDIFNYKQSLNVTEICMMIRKHSIAYQELKRKWHPLIQ